MEVGGRRRGGGGEGEREQKSCEVGVCGEDRGHVTWEGRLHGSKTRKLIGPNSRTISKSSRRGITCHNANGIVTMHESNQNSSCNALRFERDF